MLLHVFNGNQQMPVNTAGYIFSLLCSKITKNFEIVTSEYSPSWSSRLGHLQRMRAPLSSPACKVWRPEIQREKMACKLSVMPWQLAYRRAKFGHPLNPPLACHGAATLQRREICWASGDSVGWGNKLKRGPNLEYRTLPNNPSPSPSNLTTEFCQVNSGRDRGWKGVTILVNTCLQFSGTGAQTNLIPVMNQKYL